MREIISKKRWQLLAKRIDRDIKRKNRDKKRLRLHGYRKITFDDNLKPNDNPRYNYQEFSYSFPTKLNFFDDTDSVSVVVTDILQSVDADSSINMVNLDMTKVESIDNATIVIILTLAHYLNRRNINVKGRVPENENARTSLIESDFFSHVRTNCKVNKAGKDTIFTKKGLREIDQDVNVEQIRKIVAHLTGKEANHEDLYNAFGEIQLNSVEHANKDNSRKNWFMSVHYEEERCFIIMSDIGEGIIKTLNPKLDQKVSAFVRNEKDPDVLLNLFKGKYQSSTREPNRNTGLPSIFDSVKKQQIGKIYVISNKACIELSDESTKVLNNNFPGTLYAIEVTKENIDHESD